MAEQCKFKNQNNKYICKITEGYCQFLENGYEDGHICPIRQNYKDWKKQKNK